MYLKYYIRVFCLAAVPLRAAFEITTSVLTPEIPGTLPAAGPVNLPRQPRLVVAASNPFGLREVRYRAASLEYPWKTGALEFTGTSFEARDLYRETALGVTLLLRIRDGFHVAGILNYYTLEILRYGRAAGVGLGLGWVYAIAEDLAWITVLNNLRRVGDPALRMALPQVVSTVIHWRPAAGIGVIAGWEQDLWHTGRWYGGVRIQILPGFSLAAGFITNPASPGAGTRFVYSRLQIEYGVTYHVQLGCTQFLSVGMVLSGP